MKRPLGVTILAILAFIGGILAILAGVGAVAVGGIATGAAAAAAAHVSTVFLMGMGIALLVVGVLDIVLGVGFWRLSPWAWTLGIALQILGLIIAGVYVSQGSPISGQILGIAINLAVLIYLFTPGVRKAFGRG